MGWTSREFIGEKIINIPTREGNKVINGIFNNVLGSKIAIMIHWLVGSGNEAKFIEAKKKLGLQGISSFRANLYPGGENVRSLKESSLRTHASDLEDLVNYFRKMFPEIYLCWHSLWWSTIVYSKACQIEEVKKIVLWDPAINIYDLLEDALLWSDNLKYFILSWGIDYFVSREMVSDWWNLKESWQEKTKNIKKPVKIIVGDQSFLFDFFKNNKEFLNKYAEVCIQEWAGHEFEEEGATHKLIENTGEFLVSKLNRGFREGVLEEDQLPEWLLDTKISPPEEWSLRSQDVFVDKGETGLPFLGTETFCKRTFC